jgi:hypothetical protein
MHTSIIEFQFKKKLSNLDISLTRYEENTNNIENTFYFNY